MSFTVEPSTEEESYKLREAFLKVTEDLASKQTSLPVNMQQILLDNFWELVEMKDEQPGI